MSSNIKIWNYNQFIYNNLNTFVIMKTNKHLLFYCAKCLFIFMKFSVPIFGQQEGDFNEKTLAASYPFTVINYGTKQGLPQNHIFAIVPKNNGELIIATANGIVSYDGNKFDHLISDGRYKRYMYSELFWNERDKTIFAQPTGGGLFKIYPKFEKELDFVRSQMIGNIMFGISKSGDIISKTIGSKKHKVLYKTGIKNPQSFFFHNGKFYVSSVGSYFIIGEYKHQRISKETILKTTYNPFSKKIICYSANQLFEISPQDKMNLILSKNNVANINFTDIAFKSKDELFISSTKGLFFCTSDYNYNYNAENGLPTDGIQSLYYDSVENILFVGTQNKGLLKLVFKNCVTLDDQSTLIKASLGSVIKDHSGQILVVGSDRTIYKIGFDKVTNYFISDYYIASLAEIDNTLFLGSWESGLIVLKNKSIIAKIKMPQLGDNTVHSSFKDKYGRLWIGTGDGVSVGNNLQSLRPFKMNTIKGKIITIKELKDGRICLGGSNGVYIIDENLKLVKTISEKDGLHGNAVRCFYEDENQKIWIGTYGGGLYCYEKNKLTSINSKKNCKLNEDIHTLAKDEEGNLLMSSNQGLWQINETKLNEFYTDKIKYLVPFHYGQEAGILNTEFNGGFQNNCLKNHDYVYFPSIEGLVAFQFPTNLSKLYPTKINSIYIDDTLYTESNHVFNRSTKSIEFFYATSNYLTRNNIYYEYKLVGSSLINEWSPLQKNGNVQFTLLPYGKYIFYVRSIDGSNQTNPNVTRYSFEILPFYYETNTFRIVSLVLLFTIGYTLIRKRTKAVRKKEKNETELTNTMLELKLKAIQSKMNPHFIFNAMNNIIYLLQSNKTKEAEDLLNTFSQLLRIFLDKNESIYITIKDEFYMLKLYLKIEEKRYNGLFDFSLNYPSDLTNKQIPTLLLQPIIENAIKHGISHSEKKCHLNVVVSQEVGFIKITVKDDGIGIIKSKEINKNRVNHISIGISLVQQKIDVLYTKYGLVIELIIEDNPDENETGTLVTIKIPNND
jgi:ligand-binding sensor domain-containing protein